MDDLLTQAGFTWVLNAIKDPGLQEKYKPVILKVFKVIWFVYSNDPEFRAVVEKQTVRETNLEIAKPARGGRLSYKRPPLAVLLIDDVFTTGASMDEAARAFKKSRCTKSLG